MTPRTPASIPARTAITAATVSHLHRAWHVQLPDLADERPILVRNLTMPDGQKHDVLYVTTDKATLIALDADTGQTFWAVTPKSGTSTPSIRNRPRRLTRRIR